MAWRVPPAVVATGALLIVFLMYRSVRMDLSCDAGGWVEDSIGSASEVKQSVGGDGSATSVTQFLREKVEKGVFDDRESKELAGLDLSTRTLLSEVVVDTVRHPTLEGAVEQEGLFSLNYGVVSVVRRLVVCSAYRTSLQSFSLISLSPDFTIYTSNPDYKDLPVKDPSIYPTCIWLEDGSAGAPLFRSGQAMNETGRLSIHTGVPEFRWMNEVHGTHYDTVMIHCKFPDPVGTDAGGFLYFNLSHGPIGTGVPSELVPVYRESPSQLNPSLYEATSFQYEYGYCSAPSFTSLIPAHVKQFLMYHYELLEGKIHFFLYYSAVLEDETMEVLQPLIDGGIVTLVDFSGESNYNVMYHGQAPGINDCLYRTRYIAKWSLFWDMDEYLLFPKTSNYTLQSLLEKHKDAPWISFGKIDFRYSHCVPNKTAGHEWAVERMIFRLERPFCMDTCSAERCGEMCKSEKGMRKWFANPRKVRSAVTHSISDPKDMPDGVVLHTNVARFNHYRGLVAPRARDSCREIRDPETVSSTTDSDGKTTLIKDDELAIVASTLKTKVESLKIFGGTE